MNTIEEIKDFFRKEIINNEKLLQSAMNEYLDELEINFGKSKKDLSQDEIDRINHCRDVYRDALKESEILNYLTYEMFIKDVNENE